MLREPVLRKLCEIQNLDTSKYYDVACLIEKFNQVRSMAINRVAGHWLHISITVRH